MIQLQGYIKTKGFQVCDSRAVENFPGLWQMFLDRLPVLRTTSNLSSFNVILPQTSNTIFIPLVICHHKWQEEIAYKLKFCIFATPHLPLTVFSECWQFFQRWRFLYEGWENESVLRDYVIFLYFFSRWPLSRCEEHSIRRQSSRQTHQHVENTITTIARLVMWL